MKKTIILVALLSATYAYSQNFNPTVSVSRTFEGKLPEVHKPYIQMEVPDSLTKFDLDFDYSVFESPYKGAYDFKPYSLEMRPEPEPFTGKKLYLKAGAGWAMRPALDFVWEPCMKKRLKMSFYASHHSYIGRYRNIAPDIDFRLTDNGRWKGYDMETEAGIYGRADFSRAVLSFGAGYTGLHTKDKYSKTGYNGADFSFRAKSENPAERYLYYDIAMKARYSSDGLSSVMSPSRPTEPYSSLALNSTDFDFDAVLGPVLGRGSSIVAGFGLGMTWYDSIFCPDFNLHSTYTGVAYFAPKYLYKGRRWDLALGVKGSFNVSDTGNNGMKYPLNANKGIYIYPDIRIGFKAVLDYLDFFFKATGGDNRNSYSSLKDRNHFFTPFQAFLGPVTENTVTQYDVELGLSGNAGGRFFYKASAGYASYEKRPYSAMAVYGYGSENLFLPLVTYRNSTAFHSDISLRWLSRSINADANVRIENATFEDNAVVGGFTPALVRGDISFTYNYKKRVYAGVSAGFSSVSDGNFLPYTKTDSDSTPVLSSLVAVSVPAWVDLGLHAEYLFSKKVSFWIEVGNLLDMNIIRIPPYTTGGISAVAGICVNL